MAVSPTHNGWRWEPESARTSFYYRGTRVGHLTAAGLTSALGLASNGTITSGTALTVTTGNSVNSAGDERITAGNLRLGVVSTFASTQPTSTVVMKTGTAPAGAIVTSGGVFSSTTVVQKIIADSTVSNIQT